MKCPNCQNRNFDVYEARGFTSKESPIKECDCGHVWRVIPLGVDNRRIDTIRQGSGETVGGSHRVMFDICSFGDV
jgi:hypothetical protein